jgi:hypothetical protein
MKRGRCASLVPLGRHQGQQCVNTKQLCVYSVRDTGGLALNSDFFLLHKTLREVKSKSLMASRSISKRKEAC